MDSKSLLEHCVSVLNLYNSDIDSVDDHVNQYLKANQVSICLEYSNGFL